MMYPAKRMHLVVFCIALPGAIAASVVTEAAIPLAGAAALVFSIMALDAVACWRRSLTIGIAVAPHIRMYRGVECRFPLRITGRAPVKGMVLESRRTEVFFSRPVRFSCTKENPTVLGEAAVMPLARGSWPLISFSVQIESPLALWHRIFQVAVDAHAQVFANNRSDLRELSGLYSGAMAGIHLQQALGRGREVDKLREYVQGDSMDDIHWKATARHGRPITKEYRIERSQNVYVVIDSSRSSRRVVDHLTIAGTAKKLPVPLIERSIIAADMLSMVAARQADRVGLMAFDDRVRLHLKPGIGAHHCNMCRNALVGLQSSNVPADYREMFQFLATNIRRRAMILILADFDDPFASENYAAYVHLLAQKHAVMGICPVGGQVAPLFSRPIGSQEQMYGALSGHLKWRGLQKMRRVIRVKGSEIVTSTPHDLPSLAVKTYMSMKRRQIV